MTPRLEELLIQFDKDDKGDAVAAVLDVCDLIYFTGEKQLYDDVEYGLADLPSDQLYDAMRLKHTPGVKAGDNLPANALPSGEKIEHTHAMGSLKKYREPNFDDMMKLFSGKIIIMEKLDGMSTRTYYDKGMLTLAVTRHKANLGRNVTKKVVKIFPRWGGKAIINGETMLVGDAYKKMDMANRRNAIGGLLGRDELTDEEASHIRYFAYEFVEGAPSDNQEENLEALRKSGYCIPKYEIVDAKDINPDRLEELFNKWKTESEREYDIDGLVLSPLIYKFENETEPTMKVAYKIQLAGAWTRVDQVQSICTRQGFVIPRIKVEPISVDQVIITYITGSNYSLLRDREIVKGSRVYVIRSNGVIPFIEEVDNASLEDDGIIVSDELKKTIPTKCPCCGTVLVKQETQGGKGKMLYCPNTNCPAKLDGNLIYFFIKIGVKNIGKGLLSNLAAKSIEDVYAMSVEQIMETEGFAKGRAESLYNQIRNLLIDIEDAVLLSAMGIPMVSLKTSELICNELSLDEIFGATVDPAALLARLTKIEGMGEGKAKQIISYMKRGREIYEFLLSQGMKVKKRKIDIQKKEAIYGKKFVMTGKGRLSRGEYEKLIRRAGGKVSSAVSGKTDYLITDDPNGTSAKLRDAKKKGVPVITYKKLEVMLGL